MKLPAMALLHAGDWRVAMLSSFFVWTSPAALRMSAVLSPG